MATTVLLVEDDPDNYDMLSRRLERRGYDVTVAVDGEEGLEKAAEMHPDVILMDIKLPGLDGYEAIRRIRDWSDADGSGVPIIALTAHALTEDKQKAQAAGCDDYHAKPVFFEELVRQLEKLLEPNQTGS